jgi:hypothetical protein
MSRFVVDSVDVRTRFISLLAAKLIVFGSVKNSTPLVSNFINYSHKQAFQAFHY